MNDEFGKFHPATNLIFFIVVIAFSTFWMQAGMIAVSFVCATVYYFALKRTEGLKYFFMVLITMVIASCINPLFSHRGETILFRLPTGNPVTLESIMFGLAAGFILGEVLLWFSAFNQIMTDDKLTSSIGKVAPTISMIVSMVFRFIPKYMRFAKETRNIQEANHFEGESKLKNSMNVYSITATWALESSIDTADAMKARGYGKRKRTNYHNYKFEFRDLLLILWMVALSVMIIFGITKGEMRTTFYPGLTDKESPIVLGCYILLCITPIIINIWEGLRWHISRSKI